MKDDEIVKMLRSAGSKGSSAVQLAELLDELTEGGLSDAAIVTYFKRAFPGIPLRVLREAGGWSRVSSGGVSDDEFNRLIQPWLV